MLDFNFLVPSNTTLCSMQNGDGFFLSKIRLFLSVGMFPTFRFFLVGYDEELTCLDV